MVLLLIVSTALAIIAYLACFRLKTGQRLVVVGAVFVLPLVPLLLWAVFIGDR